MTIKYCTYHLNLGFGYVFAPLHICTCSGSLFLTGDCELLVSGLVNLFWIKSASLKLRIPVENAPAKEQGDELVMYSPDP